MPFQNILFYKYVTIEDPHAFADVLRTRAQEFGLKGRAIISEEGINATFEGTLEKTQAFIALLKEDSRLTDLNVKTSVGDGKTFPRLSVKVRKEIVGTQFSQAEADPRVRTAPRISPETLRGMYESQEEFVVIDMRNSYEFASGHFKNSIDPGMRASRDLEKAVIKLERYKDKKIVTVCTGGVRCEKMSAYLLNKGFKDVSQLEDGIHAYMQKFPGKDFAGTLYTFDDRIMMDFGGDREIVGACHFCKEKTERYLNCGNYTCHLHFLVCDRCASENTKVFCSNTCKVQANLLTQYDRSKKALLPWKNELKRIRRHFLRRFYRGMWRVRRLRSASLVRADQ